MNKTIILILATAMVIGLSQIANAELVDQWLLAEGSGDELYSSGSWGTVLTLDTTEGTGEPTGTANWVTTPGYKGLYFDDDIFRGGAHWGSDWYKGDFLQYTVTAWIKPDETAGGFVGDNDVFNAGESGALMSITDGYGFGYPEVSVHHLGYFHWGPIPEGEWIHVAHVVYGRGTGEETDPMMYLYVNGDTVHQRNAYWNDPTPYLESDSPRFFRFGGWGAPWRQYFNGWVDELSFYNTALNDTEIKALYNAGPVTEIPLNFTADLPPAYLGGEYNGQMSVFGGTPPYLGFSIIAGALPTGLQMDTNGGTITGVPTSTGTFDFTVQVEDQQDTVARDYSIQVVDLDPSIIPAVTLWWNTAEGEVYSLSWSETEPGPYTTIDTFTGTGGTMTFVDVGDPAAGRSNPGFNQTVNRYYKIEHQ